MITIKELKKMEKIPTYLEFETLEKLELNFLKEGNITLAHKSRELIEELDEYYREKYKT